MSPRTRGFIRDRAAHIMQKYMRQAERRLPALGGRRITPHVLCDALLQSGVNVAVTRCE